LLEKSNNQIDFVKKHVYQNEVLQDELRKRSNSPIKKDSGKHVNLKGRTSATASPAARSQ